MSTTTTRIMGFAGLMMVAVALPMQFGDTAVVSSTVREIYAEAPGDLLPAASSHAGHNDGGAKAGKGGKTKKNYRRRHSTSGDDGYSHYDSFHIKNGDKYGYEKHSAYGKGKSGSAAGSYHDDQGGEASHHKETDFADAKKAYTAPRSQSLHDQSKDAFQLSDNRQRKQLHDDDGDLFFMFGGGGDSYVAADGSEGSDEGDQGGDHEGDEGGDHAEADDDVDHDQDDDSGQRQRRKKADDEDSSEGGDYDE